jgi:hypothetical protein
MEKSRYIVEFIPAKDISGKDIITFVAKRTYDIDPHTGKTEISAEQVPVEMTDRYYKNGDPYTSSVEAEAETAPCKIRADIILKGKAIAPGEKPSASWDVTLNMGKYRKRVVIFGQRKCIYHPLKKESKDPMKRVYTPPTFTNPRPITSMELKYENAYGGKSFIVPLYPEAYAEAKKKAEEKYGSNKTSAESKKEENPEFDMMHCPTNPAGKGFILGNFRETVDNTELPNIEDPENLLTPENIVQDIMNIKNFPVPAGFGYFGKNWHPRSSYAGVPASDAEDARERIHDEILKLDIENPEERKTIEALLNADVPVMKPEFYNAAAKGLSVQDLSGDEDVRITNVHPSGMYFFRLPSDRPLITLDRGRGIENIETVLDTVEIRTEENKFHLIWRGNIPCGGVKELSEYKKFEIDVKDLKISEYNEIVRMPQKDSSVDRDGTHIFHGENETGEEKIEKKPETDEKENEKIKAKKEKLKKIEKIKERLAQIKAAEAKKKK